MGYWESVVALRKAATIGAAVFLTKAGAESQALTGQLVTFFSLMLHLEFRPFVRVTDEHNALHYAEMWALATAFFTFWTGLMFFVIDSKLGGDRVVLLFFTIVLIVVNSVYLLTAMRWFLILKLMDLADDIQIEYTKGATYEELAMKSRIVRWLKLIVPEWRVVYGLWQRAAWKRASKKVVTITRISRVLSATGSGSAFGVKPGVKSTKIVPGSTPSFLDAAKVLKKDNSEGSFKEEVWSYNEGNEMKAPVEEKDAGDAKLKYKSSEPGAKFSSAQKLGDFNAGSSPESESKASIIPSEKTATKVSKQKSLLAPHPPSKSAGTKEEGLPDSESKVSITPRGGKEREGSKEKSLVASKRPPEPVNEGQQLIYLLPGSRKIRVILVENHGLSFKKVGHGVGVRKLKPEGMLAKDPLRHKLTKGLHLVAVGD